MRRPELTPIQIEANRRWWLNDLRSKAFQQGEAALKMGTEAEGIKHCCLGVACESYRAATGLGSWDDSGNGYYEFVDDASERNGIIIEKSDVARWLNLDADLESRLINMNDHGKSYAQIATAAEKAWKMGRYA